MKKLNAKGFTLIELLAVITIMGILMIVAIPTVSRTIENTRRDNFLDTAKQYVNGVKTMWTADNLICGVPDSSQTNGVSVDSLPSSAVSSGKYAIMINSSHVGSAIPSSGYWGKLPSVTNVKIPAVLESGGKSSWSNLDVEGIVIAQVNDSKVKYSIVLRDKSSHGISDDNQAVDYIKKKRSNVTDDAEDFADIDMSTFDGICVEIDD